MDQLKKYLVIFVNCFIAVIVAIAFVLPQSETLRVLKQDLLQKQIDLKERQDYFEKIKSFSRELSKRSVEMEKINSSLPLEDYFLPDIFDFLQKTASQNGIVIQDMKPGASQLVLENPQVRKKGITMTASGSYSSFKNFISALEKSARLIQIDSLSFSSPKNKDVFIFNLSFFVNALFK